MADYVGIPTSDKPFEATLPNEPVHDPATGLTFLFRPNDYGGFSIDLFGDCLPFGNRNLGFDSEGQEIYSGTSTIDPRCFRPVVVEENE